MPSTPTEHGNDEPPTARVGTTARTALRAVDVPPGRAVAGSEAPGTPMRVVEVQAALGPGRVRLPGGPARVAVPGYEPRPGDRVLVGRTDRGDAFVIGVVDAPRTPWVDALLDETGARDACDEGRAETGGTAGGRPASELPRPNRGSAHDAEEVGADPARVDDGADAREVRDARGRLLFRYDPASGRAELHVPAGDLDLHVAEGALGLRARDGVRVEAGDGAARTTVGVAPGELTLAGRTLTAVAERADLALERAALRARDVETHVDRARHVARVVETRVTRLVERLRDAYREVEGVQQTRAGRLRLAAEKSASLVAQRVLWKARDRMKLQGERIHLA